VVIRDFGGESSWAFAGVFDGHGKDNPILPATSSAF
jgi:hypothetical protein